MAKLNDSNPTNIINAKKGCFLHLNVSTNKHNILHTGTEKNIGYI